MKNKTLIAVFIAALTLISCKDEKVKEAPAPKVDDSFYITFNLVVQKNDNFQIYYNEDASDSFPPDQYVDVAVKGSEQPQEITFKLPDNTLPASLRFDLGNNKEQGEIKINDFKMKYHDKAFSAPAISFINYFWNTDQIEYNKEKAIAKPKTTGDAPYDPIFLATELLKIELKKITR